MSEENEFFKDQQVDPEKAPVRESAEPTQASKPVITPEEFTVKPQREDYEDAHYEPEEENTRPPRYYTPPEKPSREAKPKKEKSDGAGKVIAVICAILIAALLGGMVGSTLTRSGINARMDALEQSLSAHEASLEELRQNNAAIAAAAAAAMETSTETTVLLPPSDIYDLATRQVVGIRTEITATNFFGMTSSGAVSGSGFIISEDGYILTNYHVVEDAYSGKLDIEVISYDGTKYNAEIVGVEPSNDIAVLKIEAEGLSAASIGNSSGVRVGDTVFAIGNPLGELEFSMSTGHVSALDREITTDHDSSINMFQIDAAVNEGNSGGPVYNARGEVIGIVTAKYSSSGVEGLGFAIPIDDAKSISSDLITKGYVTGKAYMGVSINQTYNAMYAQYWNTPLGAYVGTPDGENGVSPGSAADKAGIRDGDIITAVGEYKVESYADLKEALKHFSAYETTEVTVYRAGEELHLTITFDEARPN